VKIERDFQYLAEGCTADDLLAAVVAAGHSNTRARRAVLAALCWAGGQATPAQLLTLGRVHQPALGLVTVYRTLEILSGLGLVRKLHLEEGCSTYALSPAGILHPEGERDQLVHPSQAPAHSHHVICRRCRRATEFAGCDIHVIVATVEAQTGYRIHEHWLEMFGLCPECQSAGTAAPGDAAVVSHGED
jgi:Fe2+ or Zn2+ uptake regulation protein